MGKDKSEKKEKKEKKSSEKRITRPESSDAPGEKTVKK
jgi:hypothetical protein